MKLTSTQQSLIVEQLGKFFKLDIEIPVKIYSNTKDGSIDIQLYVYSFETPYTRIIVSISSMEGTIAKGEIHFIKFTEDDATFSRAVLWNNPIEKEAFELDLATTYLIEVIAPNIVEMMEGEFAFYDFEIDQSLYEKLWNIILFQNGGYISKDGTLLMSQIPTAPTQEKIPPMGETMNRVPYLKKEVEHYFEKLSQYIQTKFFLQHLFSTESDAWLEVLLSFNDEAYKNIKERLGKNGDLSFSEAGLVHGEIDRLLYKYVGLTNVIAELDGIYNELTNAPHSLKFIGNILRMQDSLIGQDKLPLEILEMLSIEEGHYAPFANIMTTASKYIGYDVLENIVSPYYPDVYLLDDEPFEVLATIITQSKVDLETFHSAVSSGVFNDYCPEWLEELYYQNSYKWIKIPYDSKGQCYQLEGLNAEDIRKNIFGHIIEGFRTYHYNMLLIYAYEKLTQK